MGIKYWIEVRILSIQCLCRRRRCILGIEMGDGLSFCCAGVWKRFKYCQQCQLIIVERKKWEKCWDEVKYCGEKCRRQAGAERGGSRQAGPADEGPG